MTNPWNKLAPEDAPTVDLIARLTRERDEARAALDRSYEREEVRTSLERERRDEVERLREALRKVIDAEWDHAGGHIPEAERIARAALEGGGR